MKLNQISALALAGVLSLSVLAGCASDKGDASTPPTATPPAVTATPSPAPSDLPQNSEPPAPSGSATPETTPAPDQTDKPTDMPTDKPTDKPSELPETKPSQAPAPETSVVQSVWGEISGWELPSLMDLDATLLSDLYGIAAGDLEEFVAKMPMMSANVTELLIAKCAPGKVDSVKAACEARQATLAADTLYPESTRLVEDYKLVTSGDYIIFCIDEKAADMVTTFENYAK